MDKERQSLTRPPPAKDAPAAGAGDGLFTAPRDAPLKSDVRPELVPPDTRVLSGEEVGCGRACKFETELF